METVRSVWNLKTRIIDFSGSHNLNWSQFPEQVVPSLINAYTPFAPQIRCRSHSFEWLHPSMSMLSIRATRALIWYDWLIFVDPVYLFDLLGFRGHAQVLPKYGIEATEKGTSIMAALDLRAVYQGTPNIACCAFDPVSHCCCQNWNARCSILHSADWSLKAILKDMIARLDINWFVSSPLGKLGSENMLMSWWDGISCSDSLKVNSCRQNHVEVEWTSSGGLDLCSKASRTSRRSHQQGMLCLVEDVGIFSKNMPDALTCNCTFFKSVESITFIIIIAAEKIILCFLSLWRPWRTQGNLWAQLWIGK